MKALEEEEVGYVKSFIRTHADSLLLASASRRKQGNDCRDYIGSDLWDSYMHKSLKALIPYTSLHPNTIGYCKRQTIKTNWELFGILPRSTGISSYLIAKQLHI